MIKYIIILSSVLFLSCEKELVYGSDFKFSFENTGSLNDEIQLNQIKQFDIKLFDLNSVDQNQEFDLKVSFSSGNGEIIIDNNLLEQNVFFKVNPLNNIININFLPKTEGNITLNFTLRNSENVIKTENITFKISNKDYRFTFNVSPLTIDTNLYQDNSLTIDIKNISTSINNTNFKIKYISSGSGELKNANNIITPYTFLDYKEGVINLIYNPKSVGVHKLYFYCKNLLNEEKEISITLNVKPIPFNLTKGVDFTNKESLFSDFTFVLNNVSSEIKYFILFESEQNSNIYLNKNQIPLNEFIPLNINSSNTYTYNYKTNNIKDDILKIKIKDEFGQLKTINYNISCYSKPIINSFSLQDLSIYDYWYLTTINYTLFGNASIKSYELQSYNHYSLKYESNTSLQNSPAHIFTNVKWFGKIELKSVTRFRVEDTDGAWSDWKLIH